MLRSVSICSLLALGGALAFAMPAQALTIQECGTKYQEAKTAGTLKGMKWNDFRKSQCGDQDVSPADAAAAETAPPATPAAAPATPAAPTPTVKAGNAVFPAAVSKEFVNETPGKARLHTCAAQWRANKASNGNGDLKWIQKGGGYWSQCNAKLKAATPG